MPPNIHFHDVREDDIDIKLSHTCRKWRIAFLLLRSDIQNVHYLSLTLRRFNYIFWFNISNELSISVSMGFSFENPDVINWLHYMWTHTCCIISNSPVQKRNEKYSKIILWKSTSSHLNILVNVVVCRFMLFILPFILRQWMKSYVFITTLQCTALNLIL